MAKCTDGTRFAGMTPDQYERAIEQAMRDLQVMVGMFGDVATVEDARVTRARNVEIDEHSRNTHHAYVLNRSILAIEAAGKLLEAWVAVQKLDDTASWK